MADITNPQLIWIKGILFLILGMFASIWLWVENPTLTTAALLTISIWSFCRFYYFTFYVIEHYVDPTFRFAGLYSFLKYALGNQSKTVEKPSPQSHESDT